MFDQLSQYIDTIISGIAGSVGGFIFGKANRRSIEVDTLIKTIKNHEDSILFQAKQLEELRNDLHNCHEEMRQIIDEKLSNFEEKQKNTTK